jgi:hypothetical protein
MTMYGITDVDTGKVLQVWRQGCFGLRYRPTGVEESMGKQMWR